VPPKVLILRYVVSVTLIFDLLTSKSNHHHHPRISSRRKSWTKL